MSALAYNLVGMSVADFLSWFPNDTRIWQLVDGEPRMMAPPSPTHGLIQGELASVIRNHLLAKGGPCRLFVTPGIVPRIHASNNMRIPDLAVSSVRQPPGQRALVDPVLIVEILSPSNEAETWTNVWTYTTIPSVSEIAVLRTDGIGAEILRRAPGSAWPPEPERVEAGELVLDSIELRTGLAALYRGTYLDPDEN